MRYFTKQWYKDRKEQREARISSGELTDFFEELKIGKVLEEFLEHGRSIEQEANPLWKTYEQKAYEHAERSRVENTVGNEYRNYYEQIRPNLPDGIKSITNGRSMHDYIIIDIHFVGDDLFIIFEDYGVKSYRDQLDPVSIADYEGDTFFISKLIFKGATVLINEPSLWPKTFAYWSFTEVYINADSYELHILTEVPAADSEDDYLAELIITFKDIIIEIEER